jgi:hypothetical protein
MSELFSVVSSLSSVSNTVVEAVAAIVEPFVNIADGASQLIGMFV